MELMQEVKDKLDTLSKQEFILANETTGVAVKLGFGDITTLTMALAGVGDRMQKEEGPYANIKEKDRALDVIRGLIVALSTISGLDACLNIQDPSNPITAITGKGMVH